LGYRARKEAGKKGEAIWGSLVEVGLGEKKPSTCAIQGRREDFNERKFRNRIEKDR